MTASKTDALDKINARRAKAGVIGLGYVGLPIVASAARGGFPAVGFDIDPDKPREILAGRSYIDAVSSDELGRFVAEGKVDATTDFDRLGECDVILICVPTPLTRQREPDLSYVEKTGEAIAARLRPGQLVILESTTYPGTTEEVLKPILEKTGLKSGTDFWLAFSPEREDPGNSTFNTVTIPKVAAGDGADATELVLAFYGAFLKRVVGVSTPATAEAVKITENVFRAVNIALVNELKVIYDAMGIDVWEVIDAAATKPFGFMPFYPGPGLGGHCIPIDPFYLSWKAREYELTTRFIELAGEINVKMPAYVIARLEQALDHHRKTSLSSARILILGLAYKKNVSDIRESPSLRLFDLLEARGATVDYHDPFVPQIPQTREHAALAGRTSVVLSPETLARYDAVLVATDHDTMDLALLAAYDGVVVDTRNALRNRDLRAPVTVRA